MINKLMTWQKVIMGSSFMMPFIQNDALSIELIRDALEAAKDASNGKYFYATLCLGNWNYFTAVKSEKRAPKLEATHLKKSKELYTKVMVEHPTNMYSVNG
nr:protein CTR9 homolog [Tanacetum cinerariifolium]